MAILGAVLLEGRRALERLAGHLQAEDFYLDKHRLIFGRMLALHEADQGVDLVTVSEALRQTGELEAAGGPAALALLMEHASVLAHLEEYVRIVLRYWGERARIALYSAGIAHAYNGGSHDVDVAEQLVRITERTDPEAAATLAVRAVAPIPAAEAFDAVIDTLADPETDLLPTPIPELNDRLGGGLKMAEVMLLGGRPGTAKTALALQAATLAAGLGHRTLILSREMMNEALVRRILAQHAQVSATALRKRDLAPDELARILRVAPRLRQLPLWFDDQSSTIGQIRRVVRRGHYRLVVIDYLQLVRSPQDVKNRRLEVTAVSAALKDLAKRGGCTVLCLSALRRLQTERGKRKRLAPALEDLKESGDLEADADVVVLLHQPNPESSDRELVFAKLREGEAGGSVTLAFTPVYVRFTEVPMTLPRVGREPGDEVPF